MITIKEAIKKIEQKELLGYVCCVCEADDEYILYVAYKFDNECVDDTAFGIRKTTGQIRDLGGEEAFLNDSPIVWRRDSFRKRGKYIGHAADLPTDIRSESALTAKPVHLFSHGFREITQLMKSAFPKEEQTSVLLLLLGTLRKNTHFTAFYIGDKFAGLLYTIENARYYFILYLAVNPKMRSGGIGGEILNYAYLQAGNRIIVLNVEPLDSTADNCEQRERRIAFYGRHGICETGYGFSSDGVAYSVLTSNLQVFDSDEYAKMLGVELFDMSVDTNL